MDNSNFIPVIPWQVRTKNNEYTDIITLLGLSVAAMSDAIPNDGRMAPPVAAPVINGKQYSLADVLTALKGAIAAVLPTVTSDDNGKVLTVVEGEWAAASVLPEVTGDDDGKVLTVSEGEWVAAALPS